MYGRRGIGVVWEWYLPDVAAAYRDLFLLCYSPAVTCVSTTQWSYGAGLGEESEGLVCVKGKYSVLRNICQGRLQCRCSLSMHRKECSEKRIWRWLVSVPSPRHKANPSGIIFCVHNGVVLRDSSYERIRPKQLEWNKMENLERGKELSTGCFLSNFIP